MDEPRDVPAEHAPENPPGPPAEPDAAHDSGAPLSAENDIHVKRSK
jgi:hypothetical protein